MQSNTPSPELVAHVKLLVGDEELSDEQINRVIVCYHAALDGEPIGTSFIHEETGAIAKRMTIDGVPKWQISDEEVTFDTRSTFEGVEGWTLVKRPVPA